MARAQKQDDTVDIYKSRNSSKEDPEAKLKGSAIWQQIKSQFSTVEQKIFIEHWIGLVDQFHGDVVHAEYLQITELIKLELLANRVLEEQQGCTSSIENLTRLIQTQNDRDEDQRDHRLLEGYESSIISNRSALISLKKTYLDIIEKKEKALNGLKATRQQRFQAIENSKSNILDWFKLLVSDESVRKRIGIEAEKMRLSIEQERVRLSELHAFEDKEIDRPLLTSDTVTEEDSK